MKNEYLFTSKKNHDEALKYGNDEITTASLKMKDTQLWIVSFSAQNTWHS